jgi:mevalonate kinase
LGVSNRLLNNIVDTLAAQPQIYGAKISGAGLGDCVIGLGSVNDQLFSDQPKLQQFSVIIDDQGLLYGSN